MKKQRGRIVYLSIMMTLALVGVVNMIQADSMTSLVIALFATFILVHGSITTGIEVYLSLKKQEGD